MHQLQQHILSQLVIRQYARYADLKPVDVDGNLFTYHLRKLIDANLLEKNDDGHYQLTANGSIFVENLSWTTFSPRIQPKIVTLTICANPHGQFLLYRRKRQPFLGRIGFPYGKIHLGEKIQNAAQRELLEKTGLVADIQHIGDVYLASYIHDELISHILGHICIATETQGNLIPESSIGSSFWSTVDQTQADQYIPGFLDLYQLYKNPKTNNRFFYEWEYHLE